MKLITSQEFLLFIDENEAGVVPNDFEGINLDDFIEYWRFPSPCGEYPIR